MQPRRCHLFESQYPAVSVYTKNKIPDVFSVSRFVEICICQHITILFDAFSSRLWWRYIDISFKFDSVEVFLKGRNVPATDWVRRSLRLVKFTSLYADHIYLIPLPNETILDWFKLKTPPDDKINVAQKIKFVFIRIKICLFSSYWKKRFDHHLNISSTDLRSSSVIRYMI